MIELPKQREDWDCGIAAAEYFSCLRGYKFPEWGEAVRVAGSTKLDGTSPWGLVVLLSKFSGKTFCVTSENLAEVSFPSLINYQEGGDGHWGVLVGKSTEYAWVFDPACGVIRRVTLYVLESLFYSRRYGKRQSVREL